MARADESAFFSHTVLKWGAYFPPGTMVRNSLLWVGLEM